MVLQVPNEDGYLKIFESAFAGLDALALSPSPLSDRFFALNAVRWLGLAPGQPTWTRLNTFYQNNGIDTVRNPPKWITKVAMLDPQQKNS
jgi:hypothetical protein